MDRFQIFRFGRNGSLVLTASWLIIVAACGSSNTVTTDSSWQPESIEADELRQIAESSGVYYMPEQDVHYTIANDKEYLYVSFEFSRETDLVKMLLFGSSLWFSSPEEQNKNVGLQFPLAQKRPEKSEDKLMELDLDPSNDSKRIQTLIDNKTHIALVNLPDQGITKIERMASDQPNATVWLHERRSSLMYASRIPLQMIKEAEITEGGTLDKLAIGFSTGKLELPSRWELSRGENPIPAGISSYKLQQLISPTQIWINVNLATP